MDALDRGIEICASISDTPGLQVEFAKAAMGDKLGSRVTWRKDEDAVIEPLQHL